MPRIEVPRIDMPGLQPITPPPAASCFDEATGRRRKPAIPLKSERMRIIVRGRLAVVSREQVFRNDEAASVEATITFPVPVHATLHHLAATIGERTLVAKALRRDAARETYEQAVEDGKTAVLHEELVRGVHVLSVAHIAPGATIAVTHAWIAPLAPGPDDAWSMRIPVSVGDIYGVSPFNDADDLATSAEIVHEAEVGVDCGQAVATVGGARLSDGETRRIRLDAPIDLALSNLSEETVEGIAADGRRVAVSIGSDAGGDAAIDAAVLVDRSGSMGESLSMAPGTPTKHQGVVAGLSRAAGELRGSDAVELWEFDSTVERVSAPGAPLAQALHMLGQPRGGTEIGAAVSAVVRGSRAGDIVLVTDGLSHALDVQALARSGRRFTVVLVGADAFEANVGRLAALTDGQIFLVREAADAATAVGRAMATLRRANARLEAVAWPLTTATTKCGGAEVAAAWDGPASGRADAFATAVGAFAAALVLPRLPKDQAAQVAADHAIVSHLTSLVLVDAASEVQKQIPAQRKVPLMVMRAAVAPVLAAGCPAPVAMAAPSPTAGAPAPPAPRSRALPTFPWIGASPTPRPAPVPAPTSLADLARRIDWGADPEALRRGDLASLDPDVADRIVAASRRPEVTALSGPFGSPVAIVIGLMAKACGIWNRAAARIASVALRDLDANAVATARIALGL